jgi:ubiquinone/menaquinone biosynthesis C-methylase UbiE
MYQLLNGNSRTVLFFEIMTNTEFQHPVIKSQFSMTATISATPGIASRLVNGLLNVKPLSDFAKQKARAMMINRAESIGVQWRQEANRLRSRGEAVWEAERQKIEDPALQYPAYYLTSFHAYETGNLSWEAATEVEVASYAAHAQIWSKPGERTGDARLRRSYHDLLLKHLPQIPKKVVDLGCGAGISTFALQKIFTDAEITGVELSSYFLTVAQYQGEQQSIAIQWKHAAAESTGLAGASFDLVSTCLMFHELTQSTIQSVLREARRLVKPGGYLGIMDMNPQSETFVKMPPYVLTLLKSTEPYLDEYFMLNLEEAIVQAGFKQPVVFCNSPRHRTLIAQVG